jgi:uncharacterized membrane protein
MSAAASRSRVVEMLLRLRAEPVHPVVAIFPLSLLVASAALDAFALLAPRASYFAAARWALGAGVVFGMLVAIPGIVDTLAYPAGARGVPVRHGVLNGVVMALMLTGWWLRGLAPDARPTPLALGLSIAALLVAVVAWRLGVRLTPAPPRATARRTNAAR